MNARYRTGAVVKNLLSEDSSPPGVGPLTPVILIHAAFRSGADRYRYEIGPAGLMDRKQESRHLPSGSQASARPNKVRNPRGIAAKMEPTSAVDCPHMVHGPLRERGRRNRLDVIVSDFGWDYGSALRGKR